MCGKAAGMIWTGASGAGVPRCLSSTNGHCSGLSSSSEAAFDRLRLALRIVCSKVLEPASPDWDDLALWRDAFSAWASLSFFTPKSHVSHACRHWLAGGGRGATGEGRGTESDLNEGMGVHG